jgi:hypothetical protein
MIFSENGLYIPMVYLKIHLLAFSAWFGSEFGQACCRLAVPQSAVVWHCCWSKAGSALWCLLRTTEG